MLQILHIAAALERQIPAFTLNNFLANLSKNDLLYTNSLRSFNDIAQPRPHQTMSARNIHNLQILNGLAPQTIRRHLHPAAIQLVNHHVELLSKNVVENPLVVVWEVVIKEKVTLVAEVGDHVAATGIDVAGLK